MPHHRDEPRVTVLTGAGISTAAGIPDFRGPDGVWTHDPAQSRLLEIGPYLAERAVREACWAMWRDHAAWHAAPSPAHRALVDLQRAGLLRALLTQNIDGLHQVAGSIDVVELHGGLTTTSCFTCGRTTATRDVLDRLPVDPDPHCPDCGGVLKPDVVYFGERLDEAALTAAIEATADAELFVAVGTTLSVQPVANLAQLAVEYGGRLVIVNAEPTGYDDLAEAVVRDPIEQAVPALVADLLAGTA